MARSQRKGNGCPPNWPQSTCTRRALILGPKSIGRRYHRTVTRNRCVALAHARRIWKRSPRGCSMWRDDGSDGIYGRVLDSPL